MSALRRKLSKSGSIGIVVATVIASLTVAWMGTELAPRTAPSMATPRGVVTINGERWTVSYDGATSGYFAPPQDSMLRGCPMTEPAGGQFAVSISVTNLAASSAHTIERVALGEPFSLLGTSQTLPVLVSPGGTATIVLTIQTPSTSGTYVLSGAVVSS